MDSPERVAPSRPALSTQFWSGGPTLLGSACIALCIGILTLVVLFLRPDRDVFTSVLCITIVLAAGVVTELVRSRFPER